MVIYRERLGRVAHLQKDGKFKFEEQKGVFVYSSVWGWNFLEFGKKLQIALDSFR